MVKLPIPYRSQWDANDAGDHNGDCGPTCLSMIMNYRGVAMTPDALYRIIIYDKTREDPDPATGYTNFRQLREAAEAQGIAWKYQRYDDREQALRGLRANLDAGNPGIALVRYSHWRDTLGNRFDGGHFVVVTGYDEGNIFIHDPLFGNWKPKEMGTHYRMPVDLFVAGWGDTYRPILKESIGSNFSIAYNGTIVDGGHTPPPVPPQPAPTPPSPAPTPAPTPQPPLGSLKQMDNVERRIRTLAAYRWAEPPDFNNPTSLSIWQEHLGDFALEYEEYVVRSGDTLSGLAARHYGGQNRWAALKVYNDMGRDGLWLGETIKIFRLGDSGAHINPALPHDTADLSKDLEFLAIDPDQLPLDYNELMLESSMGIGFDV